MLTFLYLFNLPETETTIRNIIRIGTLPLVANPLNFHAGQSTSIGLIVGYSIS